MTLKSNENSQAKNDFLSQIIKDSSSQAKNNPKFLLKVSSMIQFWKGLGLPATGYSFDEHAYTVLSAIEGQDFQMDMVRYVLRDVHGFAPLFGNQSKKSLEKIISGSFSSNQKTEILKAILEKTQSLPDGIMSYAIANGGESSLRLILSSGVNFDVNTQIPAVLSAVTETQSGDAAHAVFVLLKEYNIPFNNEQGAKALKYSFEKIWRESDMTYKAPIHFLISTSPSPVGIMSKEQLIDIFKNHLGHVRKEKKDWALISATAYDSYNPSGQTSIGTTETWASLGNFEALTFLKEKSCKSTNLKDSEISFLTHFLKKNFEASESPAVYSDRIKKSCRDFYKGLKFLNAYDKIGTPFAKSEISEEEINIYADSLLGIGDCYQFSYGEGAEYQAKKTFLNNWYECAVDNNDTSLVNLFESLTSTHSLSPSSAEGQVKVCRWR